MENNIYSPPEADSLLTKEEKPRANLGKKILFGFIWYILFLVAVTIIGGGTVGIIASSGATDPETAKVLSEQAGERFGEEYALWILLCPLLAAVVGSWFGFLPGTKKQESNNALKNDA